MDLPSESLRSLGQSENNEYMEVKDNEGIHPKVRRENDAAAEEKEVDIMDCKASEGIDVKEIDTAGNRASITRMDVPSESLRSLG